MKKRACEIVVGDAIMPPPREVRLWMARTCKERGLPLSALQLTVTAIEEANPDKGGQWLRVTCLHTPEWSGERRAGDFVFRVRPETPWVMAERVEMGGAAA
jgi:hypothetical protein